MKNKETCQFNIICEEGFVNEAAHRYKNEPQYKKDIDFSMEQVKKDILLNLNMIAYQLASFDFIALGYEESTNELMALDLSIVAVLNDPEEERKKINLIQLRS